MFKKPKYKLKVFGQNSVILWSSVSIFGRIVKPWERRTGALTDMRSVRAVCKSLGVKQINIEL
jgi:hypothetical protein